ncbi:LCP family protein [Fictibacillus arsenicus]|uniref:Transcriptional regulator LytR n=1 Tax=Fictibacillus arsenicus TaxID=255247 RepID=A0A1V3GC93_9BACL|nr:LCP family protein [Fictibacillus arsenicus]OOE14437.1 transcriptional regulator LytR [Fictibacillus arsenicus]
MREQRIKKRKKWKKMLLVGLIVFSVLLATGLAYAYSLYSQLDQAATKMHEKIDWTGSGNQKEKIEQKEPLNILLMGVDERAGDKGRSDTLIVMKINPQDDSLTMLSIPRDTRVEIVGRGKMDKINHSYAFGGTKMTVETVENFLDLKLDYYIKVNMEALSEIVDALGGITVNNNLTWSDEGYYKKGYIYKKGEITLDGPKTLGYVRMRHLDNNGDFGRQARQRQVINAIVDKGASVSSINKIDNILEVLGDRVKTNMTFSEMKDIQKGYIGARKNKKTLELKGSGSKIDGVYYWVPTKESLKDIQNSL